MQAELNILSDNIKIVLVDTTHPGNIGATARAMKTMGMKHLALVRPALFPGAEVTARAAGADDVLVSAQVFESLAQAVSECGLVYGTSNRERNLSWPVLDPETAAASIFQHGSNDAGSAIVFGRESSGLSNEELELCNAVIRIPADERFPSLNIAAAVQIVCYELRMSALSGMEDNSSDPEVIPPPTSAQMTQLYDHMQQCLRDLEFYNPDKPKLLIRRLKRLCNRLQLDNNEYNIIRGILAAAQKAAKKNNV